MIRVGMFGVQLDATGYVVYDKNKKHYHDGDISALLKKYRSCLPKGYVYGTGGLESYTMASIAVEESVIQKNKKKRR